MAVVRSSFNSYDVFLNFRGEDTRKTFTHELYMALVQGGLSTFKDEDTMDKGEDLKSELKKAIRQSKSSIVVISKNYASSTWCLDELVLILEQRRTNRHVVLPVFYDVDPSHVRNVQKVMLDLRKDLVLVTGRVDLKELVLYLKEKLKRRVYVISSTKNDDKGGENKEKEGKKGGDKKEKDSIGDKKEEESGGGGGKEEKKMEYYGYNPNTYTIPVYHQSDKKEKGSSGEGGKKENKLEYRGYYPNTNMMRVYHQSENKEKESGGGSGSGGGKKENKMEYYGYKLQQTRGYHVAKSLLNDKWPSYGFTSYVSASQHFASRPKTVLMALWYRSKQ
ncbi:hypothetical protein LguiB_021418 [Lonicera macranthoides]